MASAEGMMFNGAQTGNMVDSTTAAGQDIRSQALEERIRFDQPHVFKAPMLRDEDRARGYNDQPADPAKYSVPSQAKDNYFTRQQIIKARGAGGADMEGVQFMAQAGTDEEVALVEEMEAQQKIAQYDQYCASLFNYKNIPGGIEALERINPGFTARRMAQIYTDAAFAAKTRAIEMIGQINCTQEDNIFKMHLDNGQITGPTLARERQPGSGYLPGNFAKDRRNLVNLTALPGRSNETGYQPQGRLPLVFGTGTEGVFDMARTLVNSGGDVGMNPQGNANTSNLNQNEYASMTRSLANRGESVMGVGNRRVAGTGGSVPANGGTF